ncbi:hypothetical protein NRB_52900 [Novosphingobium sp. 11B]
MRVAQIAQHLQPRAVRQADVEQDYVVIVAARGSEHIIPAREEIDHVAFQLQRPPDCRAKVGIIFRKQQAGQRESSGREEGKA